jgi:hypothetical protein
MKPKCHCGPFSSPHCEIKEHRHKAFLDAMGSVMPNKETRKAMAAYINPSWLTVTRETYLRKL